MFSFKTTDFVFDELIDEQKAVLFSVVQAEQLVIIESNEFDLDNIFQLKKRSSALSFQDCSVWYFAKKMKGILLTGDRQLRKYSSQSGIEVHGIFHLFDQMVENKIISYPTAIEKISNLYAKK